MADMPERKHTFGECGICLSVLLSLSVHCKLHDCTVEVRQVCGAWLSYSVIGIPFLVSESLQLKSNTLLQKATKRDFANCRYVRKNSFRFGF